MTDVSKRREPVCINHHIGVPRACTGWAVVADAWVECSRWSGPTRPAMPKTSLTPEVDPPPAWVAAVAESGRRRAH